MSDQLKHECRVFTRYLVGTSPTPYVVDSYVEAHTASALSRPVKGIDRALLTVARKHSRAAMLADSYAGLFARTGVLRSKLVLLFGILESTAEYHTKLERVPRGGIAALVGLGAIWGVVSVAAVAVFGPVHLVVGGTGDA